MVTNEDAVAEEEKNLAGLEVMAFFLVVTVVAVVMVETGKSQKVEVEREMTEKAEVEREMTEKEEVEREMTEEGMMEVETTVAGIMTAVEMNCHRLVVLMNY